MIKSHDSWQKMFQRPQDLWHIVKPHVRAIESVDGVLIIDDNIEEKPYTDENDIVCWHYDHSSGRQVKGINFMTALYHSRNVSLPVGFQIIAKTETYLDDEKKTQKRRSPISKNTHYQHLLSACVKNQIVFRTVISDVWYASAENMMFVKHTLKKHFVMPLKSNRKVALSLYMHALMTLFEELRALKPIHFIPKPLFA